MKPAGLFVLRPTVVSFRKRRALRFKGWFVAADSYQSLIDNRPKKRVLAKIRKGVLQAVGSGNYVIDLSISVSGKKGDRIIFGVLVNDSSIGMTLDATMKDRTDIYDMSIQKKMYLKGGDKVSVMITSSGLAFSALLNKMAFTVR